MLGDHDQAGNVICEIVVRQKVGNSIKTSGGPTLNKVNNLPQYASGNTSLCLRMAPTGLFPPLFHPFRAIFSALKASEMDLYIFRFYMEAFIPKASTPHNTIQSAVLVGMLD